MTSAGTSAPPERTAGAQGRGVRSNRSAQRSALLDGEVFARLPEFSDIARKDGWTAAFHFLSSVLPIAERLRIMREFWLRQFGWKGFLDHRSRDRVLVIDRGLGGAALALARDFREVQSLHPDETLLAIARERARSEGVTNVRLQTFAELESLQFPENMFDLIVLHRVLRTEVGKEFCSRAAAWLRPHGSMFVVLENHGNLKERAWRFLKSRPGSPKAQLLRPFVQAFKRSTVYRYSTGIEAAGEVSALNGPARSFKARVLSKLAPVVSPALALSLWKDEGGRSLVDDVLGMVASTITTGGPGSLRIERHLFVNPFGAGFILREHTGAGTVVRIPFDDATGERIRTNHAFLQQLRAFPSPISECIPEPVMTGEIHAQPFYVERLVPGRVADTQWLNKGWAALVSSGTAWIRDLHLATARPIVLDPERLQQLILGPMEQTFALVDGISETEKRELREFMLGRLGGRTIPAVLRHGDYSIDNVLFDRHCAVQGVIDWDLAHPDGLPLLDVLYFQLTAVDRSRKEFDLFEPVSVSDRQPGMRNYVDALNIPDDLRLPLQLATFFDHVANRLRSRITCQMLQNGTYLRRALEPIRRRAGGEA